jgi:RTX calcium-binding nonapeptide repeat (4 copies)
MAHRRTCIATLAALALGAVAGGSASAQTSHEGWPQIDGATKINKDDGNDTLRGTGRSDELLGGHDSDTLYGLARADVLWGDYKPSGQGTSQYDRMYGGDGADFIYASHGRNAIFAGAGNDTIHAHYGRGSIDCGSGRDTLFISHRSKPGYTIRHCEKISFKTIGH